MDLNIFLEFVITNFAFFHDDFICIIPIMIKKRFYQTYDYFQINIYMGGWARYIPSGVVATYFRGKYIFYLRGFGT